ncbi:hypothetical protein HAX54_050276, partial [Datura stramonium]|nr:hypothetical protein [Datura stramonium]
RNITWILTEHLGNIGHRKIHLQSKETLERKEEDDRKKKYLLSCKAITQIKDKQPVDHLEKKVNKLQVEEWRNVREWSRKPRGEGEIYIF